MADRINISGSEALNVNWENLALAPPPRLLYMPAELSESRYLPTGASHTLRFSPGPGPITCYANAVEAEGGAGLVARDSQNPQPVELRPIRIDVLAPDGHVISSATVPDEDPPTAAAEVNTRGEWQIVFENAHDTNVTMGCGVRYTSLDSRELHATLLPKRVLEHAAAGAVAGAGLQVHLDGQYSYVDFSNDLKVASGGQLQRAYFDVPDYIHDINLESWTVLVPSGVDSATVLIEMHFDSEGEQEIQSIWGDADLSYVVATLEVRLWMGGPVGNRRLNVWPIVSVDLKGLIDPLSVFNIGYDIRDVEEAIRSKVQEEVDQAIYTAAVGTYMGQVLLGLAQRGEVLHDVLPSIHPEYPGIVVYHHTAETPAYPRPPVLPSPLPAPTPAALDERELANLRKFDHLVVLMQENRSFDHMLGWLQMRGRLDVNGLSGRASNTAEGLDLVRSNPLPRTAFTPSPAHDLDDVLRQINNGSMDGFVASFVAVHPLEDPALVMGYYPPNLLDTFEFLSSNYLVCDRWFCSFPGATQPNRNCALGGYTPTLNNLSVDDPALGYLDQHTIFDELSAAKVDWVYYEQDVAFLRMFNNFRIDATHVVPINDPVDGLQARLTSGTLPRVTFIDPNFVDVPLGRRANDDHAPADVANGQEMIRSLYNDLFSSTLAERILFVITYDEHGGFYDHVAPPGTKVANQQVAVQVRAIVPPSPGRTPRAGNTASERRLSVAAASQRAASRPGVRPVVGEWGWSPPPVHPDGPNFYGPRVPTLVMSAYVEPETCSHILFDHTSVLRTIALKWLGGDSLRLGPRTVKANHLGALLTRATARLNLPLMNIPGFWFAGRGAMPRVRPEDLDEFHQALARFGKPPMPRGYHPPRSFLSAAVRASAARLREHGRSRHRHPRKSYE